MVISDGGYTNVKMTLLKKLYYSEEHTNAVAELWNRRLEQGKYGSVGVTTYHHLTKSDPTKKSKRASVMGPCMLGITLTLLDDGRSVNVDAFYRTTELFKKYPADLVFIRDVILPHFCIPKLNRMRFHFANVTCHPMYFVTVIPSMEKIIPFFDTVKEADRRFYDWMIKWTARYIVPEYHRGIAKFAQALRVQMDANKRIAPKRMKLLQEYVVANHPGHRNEYEEEVTDEEDTE